MITLWSAALARAATPVEPWGEALDVDGAGGQAVVAEGPYPGSFSGPPVLHFRVRLPGPLLNAATHSEWSAPVLHGELVFVGSASGSALYALSRRDGSVREIYPADSSVEAPPVLGPDRVYFSDTGGNTYCYRLDGEQVWRHDGNAPVLVAPTLTAGGEKVLVTNVDDLAVALDAATGDLLWQYKSRRDATRSAELTLYAAPRALITDDLVVLGFSSGTLAAVDLDTGEEVWKRSIGEGRYPDLVSDPVATGTDVFASGYFKPLVAIDLPSHNVRWRVDVGAAAAPLVVPAESGSPMLYHPGSDGSLRAIATLTGAEIWRWSSGTAGALTTPILTPAGLWVASSEGSVYLVDPTTGDERWRWRESFLLRGVSAEPAIEGRQVMFVTNAGYLYSMLVPQPAEPTPWRIEGPFER